MVCLVVGTCVAGWVVHNTILRKYDAWQCAYFVPAHYFDDVIAASTRMFYGRCGSRPIRAKLIIQLRSPMTSAAHVQDEALNWQAAFKQRPPTEAIIFIVGGSTYEEAKAVAEWNTRLQQQQSNMRVLLGGSDVLNSEMFLAALGAGGAAGNGLR